MTVHTVFSLEIANQVVERCQLPYVVLVNALYGLGQLLISLDCTMATMTNFRAIATGSPVSIRPLFSFTLAMLSIAIQCHGSMDTHVKSTHI